MLSHTCLNTYFHIGLMSCSAVWYLPPVGDVRLACQLPRAQEVWFWSGSWSLLSLGTYHRNGGDLQLVNLLSTGGLVVLIQERGEISGPIRVLPISFSLKLSTMVFFIFQFLAIFASPTHLSLLLVSSPASFLF